MEYAASPLTGRPRHRTDTAHPARELASSLQVFGNAKMTTALLDRVPSRNSFVPQSALGAVSRALGIRRGTYEGREYHERGATSILGAR